MNAGAGKEGAGVPAKGTVERFALSSLPPPDFAGALESTLEHHRSLIESVPGGVVQVNASGSIIQANREALRILGLRYDEIVKKNVSDWSGSTFDEDGRPIAPSEYPVLLALATGEMQPPRTIGLRRADGSLTWAIFKAVPIKDPRTRSTCGAFVTFVDITERVAAEVAQRASEANLRTLAASIPDFVVTIDREGTIHGINRVLADLNAVEVPGKNIAEFLTTESLPTVLANVKRVFEKGETVHFESQGRGPNLGTSWYENYMGPIHGKSGIDRAILIARDVTEKRAMQMQLARSQRMASVGLLAAGVAHEINNPLAYISANLSYLRDRLTSVDPEIFAALGEAISGADRVAEIVSNLKTFSRVADDRREPVDVIKVLDSAINMASAEIRHRARLEQDFHPVPAVLASESHLGQVFLNLLVNAAQAIEARAARGRIVIAVRPDPGGEFVIVSVSDDGVGIAQKDQPFIFDPFFTTKPIGVGTGLGLSIVHNIVTSLKGRIEVKSTVGVGSTFDVYLPVTDRAPTKAADPRASVAEVVKPARKVIVIDDDVFVGRSIKRLLERNHDVTVVESGEEALDTMAAQDFDVILCDVMMPGMSGLDVLKEMRKRKPDALSGFVFITGGPYSPEVRHALEIEKVRFIAKPFTFEAISRIVAEV